MYTTCTCTCPWILLQVAKQQLLRVDENKMYSTYHDIGLSISKATYSPNDINVHVYLLIYMAQAELYGFRGPIRPSVRIGRHNSLWHSTGCNEKHYSMHMLISITYVREKWLPVRMGVRWRECWISATKQFQRIFLPSLPVEYVTSISGQTDTSEVRFGLAGKQTGRQTHRPNYRNPRCACAPRVNDH